MSVETGSGYGTVKSSLVKYNSSGSKEWSKTLWDIDNTKTYVYDIETGSDGSVYIAGGVIGLKHFVVNNSGSTSYTSPGSDLFLRKYNSDGDLKWQSISGSARIITNDDFIQAIPEFNWSSANAISVDEEHSVYITGHTTLDLGGQDNKGEWDTYIRKYDSNGNSEWTEMFGTSGDDSANSITTSSDGSIYITGVTDYSNYVGDTFISKFNTNGDNEWTQQLYNDTNQIENHITTDSEGSLYVADRGNGYSTPSLNKYSSDGSKEWTTEIGANSDTFIADITTGSNDNIYIAGETYSDLDGNLNKGHSDVFISEYNNDGNRGWSDLLGSSWGDYALTVSSYSDGSIYLTGDTFGGDDFDGLATDEWYQVFVSKFSVPQAEPTYSVNTSNTEIDEGEWITTMVSTTDLQESTELFWALQGENITADDLVNGQLTGSNYVGSDGNFSFSHTFAEDLTTEGLESLIVKLFSDQANSQLLAESSTVQINDTSTTPSTYSLNTSTNYLNEGETLNTTVNTTDVDLGTELFWALQGENITADDLVNGQLTGSNYVGSDGNFSFSHTFAEDLTTEGLESLIVKLFSDQANSQLLAESSTVQINDTSTTPSTYSLNTSTNYLNEGETLNTTVNTTDVDLGTELFWALQGENITADDLVNGQLTGSNYVGSDGNFSFSHTFAEDLTTEGLESLIVKLFSDQANSQLLAESSTVQINDTSTTPSTYSLDTSTNYLNEGETLNTTVNTTDVDLGTELFWALQGENITADDLVNGQLTGSNYVGSDGNFSLSHTFAEDLTTEGLESLIVKLFSDQTNSQLLSESSTVQINDTSKTPPTYSLDTSTNYLNEGETLSTTVNTTDVDLGTELFWALQGENITADDLVNGQLTGSNYVGSDGNFSFSHTFAEDLTTEGLESLIVKLFSDQVGNELLAQSSTVQINDTSKTPPTYSLNTSSNSLNEGEALNTTVNTTDVDLGTELFWALQGENIAADDLVNGQLTGSNYVGSDGNFSFSHTFAEDLTTEGLESLIVKLFSDQVGNELLAQSSTVQINDTSKTPPTYSLDTSTNYLNEGETLSTTVNTTDVDLGTELFWALQGENITADDLVNGQLTGSNYVGSDGNFSFSHTFAEDLTTEGLESLIVKLFSDQVGNELLAQSSTVQINDTSKTPPTYSLNTSSNSLNEGEALNTTVNTTDVDLGTELFWALQGENIAADDLVNGQLTGSNYVGSDGNFSFSHTFAEDLTTEGLESLIVKLFSDQTNSQLLAESSTVQINDTSKTPPTYSLNTSSNSLNEGDTLNTTVNTTNVDLGTELFWALEGDNFTKADLRTGQISGSSQIDNDGNIALSHTFAEDLTTEGLESLIVKLFSDQARQQLLAQSEAVQINDTSTSLEDGSGAVAFNYKLFSADSNQALDQLAVLGQGVDGTDRYKLEITAQSLLDQYNLESADVTLKFNPLIFQAINASDIQIGTDLPLANAVHIDNETGAVRIAASSLSDLAQGDGISSERLLASLTLDFDEGTLKTLGIQEDGSLAASPLIFEIEANQDETVFSRSYTEEDGSGLLNREIKSLADLGGNIHVDGTEVKLYSAGINIYEVDDGLILGSQRVIGSDTAYTNLIRSGDTITATTEWLNVGNTDANNIQVTAYDNANAQLSDYHFVDDISSVKSGRYVKGQFDQSDRESFQLVTDIKITGAAGNVVDLSDGILSLQADDSDVFVNNKGSSNLITYQGDLNYDGRVSMKDLAYLNAGAARQQTTSENTTGQDQDGNGVVDASVAHDVDADFNGKIDLADLAVLDADWGKTLHNGDQDFHGSADLSWSELDQQGTTGDAAWDNDSFKDQNAIESSPDYVGSLESPTSTGVIGADGNDNANDDDMQADVFQDPLSLS
ncbi:SBBP repeat-containing protein [Prochlorococcus sp. MIT 1306]|uniref:SBBP repeat-containing protein n=1 Tax=Prochlorococcus sp. MIT 1306 TaxID=1799667 RepID=UPI0039B5B0F4